MNEERSLVKNAADEEQVKEAAKKVIHQRDQELNDLKFLLNCQQGRRFIKKIFDDSCVFGISYRFGESSHDTAFREGSRNIGLKLLTDVNEASPDLYALMIKESKGQKT